MKILRAKWFSGYSECSSGGVSYLPSSIVTKGILDPIDNTVNLINSSDLGKVEMIRRKSNMVSKIVKPVKEILNRRRKNR